MVRVRVRVRPLVRKRGDLGKAKLSCKPDMKAPLTTGEYSCRCHGKRVISAPSKPLKLELARHTL